MAHITFYEKPGCINNTKQKSWLKAAGHNVEAFNILDHAWTGETLKRFFGDKKISDCFNRTAPVVKSGELDPEAFAEKDALERMIQEPILIKRPLILIDEEKYLQGFDKELINSLIGLDPAEGYEDVVKELEADDLTVCPKLNEDTSCGDEKEINPQLFKLTPVLETMEELGFEITYTYEDLIFVEHTAFLFKFINTEDVILYINKDCNGSDRNEFEKKIPETGKKYSLNIVRIGSFSMKQNDGEENIDLNFFD